MARLHGACLLTVLLAMSGQTSFSQHMPEGQTTREEYSKNCMYIELLGTGVLYSVDYEHLFSKNISARCGFTSWSISGLFVTSLDFLGFPLLLNFLTGSGGHYFEIGGGVLIYHITVSGNEIFFGTPVNGGGSGAVGAVTIGYRYQPPGGGFMFRVGLTPLTTFSKTQIWGGLSLGVAF